MEAVQIKIIDLLKELSGRFPVMTFMYGFDSQACQHLVDVAPTTAYTSDEYMDAESDAQAAFFDAFPYESLAFVSSHPYIRVEEPLFVAFRKYIIPFHPILSVLDAPTVVANKLEQPTMTAQDLLNQGIVAGQPSVIKSSPASLRPMVVMTRDSQYGVGEYNYGMAA